MGTPAEGVDVEGRGVPRGGGAGVVVAKFVPGLGTVMPALAGMYRVDVRRFLFFDGLGGFLYVGCFVLLGFLFRNQLQQVAEGLERLGRGAFVVLVSLLVAYIALKYIQRQRALRQLQMARITVDELCQRLDMGQGPSQWMCVPPSPPRAIPIAFPARGTCFWKKCRTGSSKSRAIRRWCFIVPVRMTRVPFVRH
ncbi:MAG: hypothetical protein ABSG14_15745 [Verrucomicrobiia bacterium]